MTTKPYDLNLGYPDLAIIPKETLAALSSELMLSDRGLQYAGDLRGIEFAREEVAQFITTHTGDPVSKSEVMITAGSLQGIDIACRSLTKPGDIALVEGPTFFFALSLLQMSHLEIVSVPMTAEGIDLDTVRTMIERYGSRLRVFYTIPSYQNPTGLCATAENRAALVALAQQHDFVLIEDTAYHYLYFNAPPPPMLKHYDAGSGHVVTVGTFSKLITPSLRQGWIWATADQIDLFTHYKGDASASLLTCELVVNYLQRGGMDEQMARVRSFYARKCARMSDALDEFFPSWTKWSIPDGGFFVWITLPPSLKAAELRAMVLPHGADFMPGNVCFPEPVADRYVRLCFAYMPDDALVKGVEIIGTALRELGRQNGI